MKIAIAAVLVPALALAAGAAGAQAQDALTGSYTFGAVAVLQYEGSEDFDVLPLVAGRLQWGNRYVELQGTTLRGSFLDSDRFEAGSVLSYRFGRGDDVDDPAVAALSKIDAAIEFGAFAAYTVPTATGLFRFAAEMLQETGEAHGGWVGTASAGYATQATDRIGLSATLSATAMSDVYAAAYFSVSEAGSQASGLAAHDVGGGREIGDLNSGRNAP